MVFWAQIRVDKTKLEQIIILPNRLELDPISFLVNFSF